MRYLCRLGLVALLVLVLLSDAWAATRPNVLLVITDDQGWGDVGVHGNDKIRTPHLDRLARQGVQLTRFYVSPVCAPTRASLMTGRYNYRTRAIDTYEGRATMHPDEVTLAQVLGGAGYRTGIFGKWHLGDHYPVRAMDKGFGEALVIPGGGGLMQPSDPPEGNSYFDPWLEHNGKKVKAKGYCSDVYTDAAIKFIGENAEANRPFFCYLPFNAPHTPLQVADELVKPYLDAGLDEKTAKVYAMVTNIDANVGRVLAALDERKIADDTIVIFMTDNGPSGQRYNGVLRSGKGSTYDGGIRVPCFVRWPKRLPAGTKIERVAAHIDLMPTLLAACDVPPPANVKLDGVSLLPLLTGGGREDGFWPDRTLYLQWHRGDVPDSGRNAAAVTQRYKLVQPLGATPGLAPKNPKWELYDLQSDPGEQRNLAAEKPDVVEKMRKEYEAWFADVSSTRGYAPVAARLGSDKENPVLLTLQDRREDRWEDEGKGPAIVGFWAVDVERPGAYDATLLFDAAKVDRTATLQVGGIAQTVAVVAGKTECTFEGFHFRSGESRLVASLRNGATVTGVRYVRVERK
jgi:arylsulfatase A-like enzyme